MPDLNAKLDRFTSAILAEATAETERTLADLAEKRTAAHTAAEEQLLGEVYRYIHSEVARVKTEAGRQVSRHMLDNKRTLYLRRDQMAKEVFAAVRERLASYTAGDTYPQRLEEIYRNAVAALNGAEEVRLFLRPADTSLAQRLTAAIPQVKAQTFEGDFMLGGLIVDAPTLGKRVDATFDSAMEELTGHFAELFGLSLSGELDEGGDKA